MKIVIVCHVETGFAEKRSIFFGKNENHRMSVEDATRGITDGIPTVIRVAEKHGAKICFMIMPEAAGMIGAPLKTDIKKHCIGLHIHTNDNELRRLKVSDGRHVPLMGLGQREQEKMIMAGKAVLVKKFGTSVKSFASGRWSVGNGTIEALARCGFSTDCSANPGSVGAFCNWGKLARLALPYEPSSHDYQSRGKSGITEIPVSKLITGAAISPESCGVGLGFLKAGAREFLGAGMPVLHIVLHSPSMTSDFYAGIFDKMLGYVSGMRDVEFTSPEKITAFEGPVPKASAMKYLPGINTTLIRSAISARLHKGA